MSESSQTTDRAPWARQLSEKARLQLADLETGIRASRIRDAARGVRNLRDHEIFGLLLIIDLLREGVDVQQG